MVVIFSHRGYHKKNDDIIENTISAFKAAEKIGITHSELDVHLTSDEQWVVYHDFKFIDGSYIVDNTYEQLSNKAGNLNHKIDLLTDVFKQCPKMYFNIECKPKSKEIGYKLSEFLANSKKLDTTHISSFSTDTLIGARKASETIKLSQLDLTFLIMNWQKINKEINLYSINPFYTFTRKGLINKAHKNNVEVHVWTVNKVKIMNKMIKRDVDGIITDYPDIRP